MTAISTFYHKILLSMPWFSLVYYILSWCFIVAYLFFTAYALTKK
jgi:hypothetical protein